LSDLTEERTDHGAAGQLPVLRVRDTATNTVPNSIGVHLYLDRDGKIPLRLRHPDSAHAPLQHHFLAGHCKREPAIARLIREAWEEAAGLVTKAENAERVHTVHLAERTGQPHGDRTDRQPPKAGRHRAPDGGQQEARRLHAGPRAGAAPSRSPFLALYTRTGSGPLPVVAC